MNAVELVNCLGSEDEMIILQRSGKHEDTIFAACPEQAKDFVRAHGKSKLASSDRWRSVFACFKKALGIQKLMNTEAIAASAASLEASLRERSGVTVTFRSVSVVVVIGPQDGGLNLLPGGFRESSQVKVRFPVSVTPPPGFDSGGNRIKESFVFGSRTYHITSCTPAPANSVMAKAHIVEAQLA